MIHHLKKFAIGVGMTALTVAALFFIVNRFAPAGIKNFYKVS